MELLHLKYFKYVAERLNYTKAAHELNISQPALSMMIKKLEQELNTKLFYKKGRNIFLTDNGYILLKSVDNIMYELSKAGDLIYKNEHSKQNTINFASSHSRLISYIFDDYIARNPQYMFNCGIETMGQIIEKLLNYNIQFALSMMRIQHPDIECRAIIDEDIVITYPKQFDSEQTIDFLYNDNIYKTFVFPSHNEDYNNLAKNKVLEMNLTINNVNYIDDAFITSIAKQRQYFAFMPVSMCKKLNLPYINDDELIIQTSIYLSSIKNVELGKANLDMYQFIETYFKQNQAFYLAD